MSKPHLIAAKHAPAIASALGSTATLTAPYTALRTEAYNEGASQGPNDPPDNPSFLSAASIAAAVGAIVAFYNGSGVGANDAPSDAADVIVSSTAQDGVTQGMADAGVEQIRLVPGENACDECLDEAGVHDIDDDVCHPNGHCNFLSVPPERAAMTIAETRSHKTQTELAKLYAQGHALKASDGTYSNGITSAQDVHDAISAIGLNTKIPADVVRRHILKHAKLYNVTPPDHWNADGTLSRSQRTPNMTQRTDKPRHRTQATVLPYTQEVRMNVDAEVPESTDGSGGWTLETNWLPAGASANVYDGVGKHGFFRETAAPTAFDDVDFSRTVLLYGHDRSSLPLGCPADGTARIWKDSAG